jgi:integration host factor subunit alpha
MQDTLTKATIVERLCKDLQLEKNISKEFVDDFFEMIRKLLESGNQLKLSGFGNFCLRDKNERPGRNPKTGETIPVEARRVVTFRPGLKLRHRVEVLSLPIKKSAKSKVKSAPASAPKAKVRPEKKAKTKS